MARKSRKKSKSRKKRGASVLSDVWDYGIVNPVSNLIVKPTEYAVGSVIPGQVGSELRARGSTHREPGMYGKKGSFFGGKRRKRRRGGSDAFANITDVKGLVNIFYKPPPMAQPNKTQHGVGVSSWESHFVTLGNQIRCYMGNMAAHKGMSRDKFIHTSSGFSNPTKRQKAWDSCKNNAKANYDQELIIKYFAKHGFINPKNLKPAPNFVQIKASPLPNGHAIVTQLMREKQGSKHTGMKYGGRKSRRRKRRKSRKSRKKRGSAPVYGVSGMKVDKPKIYTYEKGIKLKHIWEPTKDKGVYQVPDPYGFEAFKPQAKDKKYRSKLGGKRKSRKKRRRSRKRRR